MKIFLDTANLEELRKGAVCGIVDGVNTNPSPIVKEGKPLAEAPERFLRDRSEAFQPAPVSG